MQPTLSIIIPCYSRVHLLPLTLANVVPQLGSKDELILVDDGSPEDVAGAVQQFADRITFLRQENAGPSTARNLGLSRATGRYIIFLDADDLLANDCLAGRRAALEANPAVDIFVSGWKDLNPDRTLDKSSPAPSLLPDPFHAILADNIAPIHSFTTRRDLLVSLGGFDTTLKWHEDWELWLRAARSGAKFERLEAEDAFYVHYPSTLSTNTPRMALSRFLIFKGYISQYDHCTYCKKLDTETKEVFCRRLAQQWIARTSTFGELRQQYKAAAAVEPFLFLQLIRQLFYRVVNAVSNAKVQYWMKRWARKR